MGFRIHVSTQDLHQSDYASITCSIWIEVGGMAFPGEDWSDFAVEILGWWVDAVVKFLSGSADVARCEFMDGPWVFHLVPKAKDEGLWSVELGHRTVSRPDGPLDKRHPAERLVEEFSPAGDVRPEEVIEELLRSSNSLLRECLKRGWETPEIEYLEARYRQLSRARQRRPLA